MNTSGDAAEQVVRMSLEGVEVAAKITGVGAKEIALRLFTAAKQEQKTKGRARLTGMLKSGRELKVYTVRQQDLKTFTKEAKRYGVLYCVLKDRNNPSPEAPVDVIARAEDASKIQRITERFKLATIAAASVTSELAKEKDRLAPLKGTPEKHPDDLEWARQITKPLQKDEHAANPTVAKTEKSPPSEPNSKPPSRSNGSSHERPENSRPSVREKLATYRQENERLKQERALMPEHGKADKTVTIPKPPKNKVKER